MVIRDCSNAASNRKPQLIQALEGDVVEAVCTTLGVSQHAHMRGGLMRECLPGLERRGRRGSHSLSTLRQHVLPLWQPELVYQIATQNLFLDVGCLPLKVQRREPGLA
eukprot:CAMPEP_0182824924 /NCGR_PEP_ID=MMETSP0006_2-20121128/15553_1 /TAXON_ID=97485 /ORGANISM="Prymnesium parvum, Strain Texoma1" /LENGTH=107 /DNA_ID=CAMNT_0024951961 /DNA_START=138 /DNA_END=461 /DNA_ORIENTATION=-